MLGDALTDFKRQVQPREARVAAFKRFHDAQRLQIVIEAIAEAAHQAIQFLFAGMAEGRMADVVRQRESFGKIFIHTQNSGHGARDLRNLDGMRQAVAEMIRDAGGEHLGLVFEPAERPRVYHSIAVALKSVAVRMSQFRVAAPTRALQREPQMGKRGGLGHAVPVMIHAAPVVTWPVEGRETPFAQSSKKPRWPRG